MGTDSLVQGLIVCCVYAIFCYIEAHFITKEPLEFKSLIRNILLVYISYVGGMFVYNQVEPMKVLDRAPAVFTSDPDF